MVEMNHEETESPMDDNDQQQTPRRKARSTKPAGEDGPSTRQLKKIAEKAIELAGTEEQTRKVLAAALGMRETDPVTLTATIMAPGRADLTAVNDLTALATTEDRTMSAVETLAAGRPAMISMWRLMASLGVVHGQLPQRDTEAAVAVTDAAADIGDQARSDLAAVEALARKGW